MEKERQEGLQDNDFKYVLQDVGTLCLGARFTYGEMLGREDVPFKLKAIVRRYILPETAEDTSLESQFYYLAEDTFLYEVMKQLRIKVKVLIQVQKKNLAGKGSLRYEEKILSLKELADMTPAKKEAAGVIIREIIISKLGLMTFSV